MTASCYFDQPDEEGFVFKVKKGQLFLLLILCQLVLIEKRKENENCGNSLSVVFIDKLSDVEAVFGGSLALFVLCTYCM